MDLGAQCANNFVMDSTGFPIILSNRCGVTSNSPARFRRPQNPGDSRKIPTKDGVLTTDRPTSLTLLQRARDQDRDAWQRLLDLYAPLVMYWCQHWGLKGADAEDVRQEVFQAVATGLPKFSREHTGETFRGWLRGITRHKLLDHFRRESQRPVAAGGSDAQHRLAQLPGPGDDPSDAPATELQSLYHRALLVLQTEFELNTWQAFWRAAVDGHRPADIATDLGMTPAAVRKAKSRVLRQLRRGNRRFAGLALLRQR